MLTPQFIELYDQLVAAWIRYQDASRYRAEVSDLAQRRIELDAIRSAIAVERHVVEAVTMTPTDGRWLNEHGILIP